jgi:hypothetical protein
MSENTSRPLFVIQEPEFTFIFGVNLLEINFEAITANSAAENSAIKVPVYSLNPISIPACLPLFFVSTIVLGVSIANTSIKDALSISLLLSVYKALDNPPIDALKFRVLILSVFICFLH